MLRPDAATPYIVGSAVLRVVPARMAYGLAAAGAGAIAARPSPARTMAERHLRRVHGQGASRRLIRRQVRRSYASYGRYWVDALRLPHLSPERLEAEMSWEGVGHLEEARQAGKGAILALPHLGGWDFAGAWISSLGHPLTVVVEALEPPELFAWFTSFRHTLGMEVVALGPDARAVVMRALRANRVVCLLSDRDVGGGGVEVEFFGERTTLPAGPVTLGMRTGAAILPTAVYQDRSKGGHLGLVRPPLELRRTGRLRHDVAAATQALAHELEALIRRAPEQWHLFQPNWPSDRLCVPPSGAGADR